MFPLQRLKLLLFNLIRTNKTIKFKSMFKEFSWEVNYDIVIFWPTLLIAVLQFLVQFFVHLFLFLPNGDIDLIA